MEAALRRHRQPEMIEKIEQKVAKKTKEIHQSFLFILRPSVRFQWPPAPLELEERAALR